MFQINKLILFQLITNYQNCPVIIVSYMNSQSLLDSTINDQLFNQPLNNEQNSPLENLIDKVDGQGTYQIISNIIFNLMWLVTGWLLTGTSFFFDDNYKCVRNFPDDHQNQKCIKFICSLPSPQARLKEILSHSDSIAFAFQPNYMICQLDYQATILTSTIYVGSLIGFFIIPHLADNYGRKIMVHISWGICVLGALLIATAPSPILVGIGFFLAGFGANPAITLNFSFITQQVVGKWRQRFGIFLQVSFGLGQATIGLFFLGSIGWRSIFYMIFGLTLIIQFLCIYLLQTPKFLVSKSKQKFLRVLNRMAKRNKRPNLQMKQIQKFIQEEYPNRDSQNTTLITENQSESQKNPLKKQQKTSASLWLLFKYKSLVWRTLGAGFGFLGIQIIYYSTTLNLDKTGYSKIINQQIVAISQIAGYICGQFIVPKVPRKKTSIYSMLFSSLMCILIFVTDLFDNGDSDFLKYLEMFLLVANRFVLCCFWSIFYIYISELFPTKVRSLGYGWAGAVGTVGSSLAPYIILASTSIGVDSWVPPGVVGLLCLIFIARLPQTLGKPLQDEIQEQKMQKIEQAH